MPITGHHDRIIQLNEDVAGEHRVAGTQQQGLLGIPVPPGVHGHANAGCSANPLPCRLPGRKRADRLHTDSRRDFQRLIVCRQEKINRGAFSIGPNEPVAQVTLTIDRVSPETLTQPLAKLADVTLNYLVADLVVEDPVNMIEYTFLGDPPAAIAD